MLPRSRIVSVLILGLGAALIVIGSLLPQLIDAKAKLPLDLPPISYALYAEDGVSTSVAEDGSREIVTSPLRRQFHGQLVEPADADRVSLRVGVATVREVPPEVLGTDPLKELIDANVWTFSIDRLTGEFLAPATLVDRMAGVPREWPVTGYWVKLPANTEQQDYLMFDDILRESVPATFVETENRNGTELYHFRQHVPKTNLAQKYRSYVSQITQDEKTGFLQYEGTRDWWVEPKSGVVVDASEDIHLWWETREGEPMMDYLRFNGAMTDEDSARLLGGALTNFKERTLQPWSISLIVIGALVAFAGMVGAVRPDSRGRRAKSASSNAGDEHAENTNADMTDTDAVDSSSDTAGAMVATDTSAAASGFALTGSPSDQELTEGSRSSEGQGALYPLADGSDAQPRRRSSESKAYYELEVFESTADGHADAAAELPGVDAAAELPGADAAAELPEEETPR